jgi:hypothetical protein
MQLDSLEDCLVPFLTTPVPATVVWKALGESTPDEALAHRASLIADNEEAIYLSTDDVPANRRRVLAERYGGAGIVTHGGGVRCGFDGMYQFKGIGINPLVGCDASVGHSDGALSLTDALLEVMWSEILRDVLPWGVVSPLAVLATTKTLTVQRGSHQLTQRRALLLRPPAIRPAHFCRAPFFRPQPSTARRIPHDALRVQRAIRHLPMALPQPDSCDVADWNARSIEERTLLGLSELATRLGAQMAVSRTRYLVFMTSPSNCAIDGRLLDFGGVMSVFPGDSGDSFGRFMQLRKLYGEAALLGDGLHELCIHLGKHVFDRTFAEQAASTVLQAYTTALMTHICIGYLGLAGFPQAVAEMCLTSPEAAVLADCIRRIIEFEAGCAPAAGGVTDVNIHPASKIFEKLAHDIRNGKSEPSVTNIPNAGFVSRCFEAYRMVFHVYIDTVRREGLDIDTALEKLHSTMERRLRSRRFLDRDVLYRDLSAAVDNCRGNDEALRGWFSSSVENLATNNGDIFK